MTLVFGRVRTREELSSNEAVLRTAPQPAALPIATVAPKEVVDAAARAQRILADARSQAEETRARAEAELGALRERIREEARAEATAALATQTLALASREQRADEHALDRSIELARLLAERLLGEALVLEPARVVALAETALREARGARQVVLVAHPKDAPALREAVAQGRLSLVTRVVENPERQRGALRLESEIGVLDAALAPQLERLCDRLREGWMDSPK